MQADPYTTQLRDRNLGRSRQKVSLFGKPEHQFKTYIVPACRAHTTAAAYHACVWDKHTSWQQGQLIDPTLREMKERFPNLPLPLA